MDKAISWFTPLPPQQNGIADYSAILLSEIAKTRACTVYCENAASGLPANVETADPAQAFRHLKPGTPILHQIGNNGGHVFVLEALRRYGGVVSLHDLSLLYLYELATPRMEAIFGRMRCASGDLGETYARHWRDSGTKTAANYILFDMVGEVLSLAKRVIVHSHYARKKLVALHGASVGEKIDVIPHFAPDMRFPSQESARATAGIEPGTLLILTSGFATRAKRFDWMIDALDVLAQSGVDFQWVHAGAERAEEFDLSGAASRRPALAGRVKITGYVSEAMLDAYISAADIVVNLRFPSVGESSGTLARAFAAGRCCIVNDTAAYAELPRDAVVHLPVFETVAALTRALRELIASPELRELFGARARRLSQTDLSLKTVAARYIDVIDNAYGKKRKHARLPRDGLSPIGFGTDLPNRLEIRVHTSGDLRPAAQSLLAAQGPFELTAWFDSPEAFAHAAGGNTVLAKDIFHPAIEVNDVRFVASATGSEVGVVFSGRSHGDGGPV
jgi:glycosyltransferase involved in cell wall biosynthesis